MNITRQNYEEWLLLYVDNELSLAERIIVDDFLAANPDLQQELELLQQSILSADENIVFDSKAALYKSSTEFSITEENCEQYFVLYGDDELNNEQKAAVEQFVYHNPRFQESFELIQLVKARPDTSIVFPNKRSLYRSEKQRRVIPMRWYRMAAAAILLLLAGGAGYNWLMKEEVKTEMANRRSPAAARQPSNVPDVQGGTATPTTDSPAIQPAEAQLATNDNSSKGGEKPATAVQPKVSKISDKSASQVATITIPAPVAVDHRVLSDSPASNDYAVNNPEKKLPTGSNPVVASSVTYTEAALNGAEKPNTGKINPIADPGKLALSNTNDMAAIAEPSYDLMDDTEHDLLPVSDKKKPMRGLLRKVSRVFEKATNADDNSRGNIRIANFEIALK